ncbi:ribokinase [Spiribacter vilamensis]|uniref:Ribokinase n=1 Tax=Spiribacter vilamensis TaxID=531306 RepID=A0A4Q8D1D1_9GAMM|nr:ribokinase [Spiribacter vilamensis]RZU99057.1 ribokinase [Spiribacter vilamensis]
MSNVTVLGLFCADLITRTVRMPAWGETLHGRGFSLMAGGKGSNQAVAAACQGASVTFISRLGDDAFAPLARDLYTRVGIDTTHIGIEPGVSTGTATILVDDARGDNAIVIDPGACARMTGDHVNAAASRIAAADIFVCQLELPLALCEHGIALARRNGVPVVLNPAPACPLPATFFEAIDYLTPNESEAAELVGHAVETDEQVTRAAETLRQWGVGNVLITLGERGVYIDSDGFRGMVPAISAGPVVDTIGAGDAFNGALAAALADGEDLPAAARRACIAAGISVTRAGAAPALATRDEVDRWLADPG